MKISLGVFCLFFICATSLFAVEEDLPVKCHRGKDCSDHFPIDESPLKVFVSFSMPDQSLLDFSKSLEKIGGSLVFQGLPKNSFTEFSKKILELKKQGMKAQVSIDPKAFEESKITKVPTIYLEHEGKSDNIRGNISLAYALRRFSESGETKEKAIELLWTMQSSGGVLREN